jgi:hypothetical protein
MKKVLFLAFVVAIACEIGAFGAAVPRVMGQWPGIPEGEVRELTIGGDTLYAGEGNGLFGGQRGISMFDVSNPAKPRRVGTVAGPGRRIVATERYVIEYGQGALRVLDMSDRGSPLEVARIESHIVSAAAAWPYVYVGNDVNELLVYDLSNPAAPVAVNGAVAYGYFPSLTLRGSVLAGIKLSAGTTGTLQFFDVSDGTKLVPKGSYGSDIYFASPVDIAGNHAVIGRGSKIEIINIFDLASPHKVGEWPGPEVFWFAVTDVVAFPETIWAGVANTGITILDIGNPAAPVEVQTLPGLAFTGRARRGNDLFLSDYLDLKIYDVTNPAAPTLKSVSSLGGYYYGVSITNNWAFLSVSHAPSRVLDVSEPARPAARGPELPPSLSSLIAEGKLFLMDTERGVNVYDISNPAAPEFLSRFQNDAYGGLSMAVEGERLFLSGSNSVKVVNFANPRNLQLENSIELPAGNVRFARTENRLAVTTSYVSSYLSVIDITTPGNPQLMGTLTNGYLGNIAAKNFAAYIAGNGGVRIYQIVDAANPSFFKTIDVPGAGNVSVDGDRLYVLGSRSLSVYDISSPFDPKPITTLVDLPDNAFSATAAGNVAYVGAGYDGLITVQVAGAAPTQPLLEIINEGEMHRVRWRRDFDGFSLFTAPSLSGPWQRTPIPLSSPPLFFEATFGNRPGIGFYRLQD